MRMIIIVKIKSTNLVFFIISLYFNYYLARNQATKHLTKMKLDSQGKKGLIGVKGKKYEG